MSWIVQTLLNNRNLIKSSADLGNVPEHVLDDYNDVLVLEKAIDELVQKGLITKEDMYVINLVGNGKTIGSVSKTSKIIRYSRKENPIVKRFINVCNRIAFYLGGYFTDDGYLSYMKAKYNLTDEDVQKMKEYMNSRYKHMIKRNNSKNDKAIPEKM